jgi:hypothetical protein
VKTLGPENIQVVKEEENCAFSPLRQQLALAGDGGCDFHGLDMPLKERLVELW